MSATAVESRKAHGFRSRVAATMVCNVAATAAGAMASMVIARALGPAGRGEYAAILVWFGVILVVGRLGQPAATTFYVAQDPGRARDFVATSRTVLLASGAVILLAGVFVAQVLFSGDPSVTFGYQLMFATCLLSFLGTSYTFGLQASHTSRWNTVRTCQPLIYVGVIALLHLMNRLDLVTALVALSITIAGQSLLAYWLCVGSGLTRGRTRLTMARPLGRYGFGQVTSSIPAMVTYRFDQLLLSVTVTPAAMGNYAVAASLTTLAVPITSALGALAFPRIAARTMSADGRVRLQRRVILASVAIALAFIVPLAVAAPWLVPTIFGAAFTDAVWLVFLLAPGGMFLACAQVCESLLRGHGLPFSVARAQIVAAVLMVAMLVVLVPRFGVAGAAIASSVAPGVAWALMLFRLSRLTRSVREGEKPYDPPRDSTFPTPAGAANTAKQPR